MKAIDRAVGACGLGMAGVCCALVFPEGVEEVLSLLSSSYPGFLSALKQKKKKIAEVTFGPTSPPIKPAPCFMLLKVFQIMVRTCSHLCV